MRMVKERTARICQLLESLILTDGERISGITISEGRERSSVRLPFSNDQRWGGKDKHFRFYADFTVPERFDGKRVDIKVETGQNGWDAVNPQFFFFSDGELLQGLDVNHSAVTICKDVGAGKTYALELEAYSGMRDALSEFRMTAYVHNDDVERLYYNLKVPYDCLGLFDQNDKKYTDIANYLTNAINLLDLRQELSPEFFTGISAANDYMETEFYGKYCGQTDIVTYFVGHTHIDVAWLWRLAQTEEKAERSFATMLNLMEEYPEFIFSSSQPQLYKYVKNNNPALYERIKKRVSEARWEPEGAMWLEADTNITSGESLIRQLMHGKRFFKDEFGKESRLLWLPDVFGYSAALPQILKKSGVDYFVTSKISWNEYNRMPYDTFMWRGIDGTAVLTAFITTKNEAGAKVNSASTYNGIATPNQILGGWNAYKQKDINSALIAPIGYGDGGGGTTRADIEMARRMSYGIPGMPTVKMGNTLDYMDRLYDTVANNRHLPEWVGELYLEYHRGTYTSMARNKRYNRKSEILLLNTEMFSSMAAELSGKDYPHNNLLENWELVLLNQFHDILPGSSIKEVYEDSQLQYEQVKQSATNLLDDAMDSIAGGIGTEKDSLVIFNATGYHRDDVIEYEGKKGYIAGIPAAGYKTVALEEIKFNNGIIIDDRDVHTKYFDISFDDDFNIRSITDKRCGKEILSGKGNVLQAFEDLPMKYDAWDINIYYQEKMWEVNNVSSVEIQDIGAAKTLTVVRPFMSSTIRQRMVFYDDIPRIDFEYEVDWKEKHILLKAAFPVAVHNDKATYDIQFGNLERPNHWNTSWDKAKFEVCAQKWADLSQDDYGVSILNDCKYGYDIKGGNMRITLIKSAAEPNPDADREMHYFTYSLFPHSGGWRQANTPKQGYFVNYPLYNRFRPAGSAGRCSRELSMVSVDRENAVIEAFKKAEDGDGYILRVYDCFNRDSMVTAVFFKDIKDAWECDMMEQNIRSGITEAGKLVFRLSPFEIKTFRVVF